MREGKQIVAVVLHQLKDQPWSEQLVVDLRTTLAGSPSIELRISDPEGAAARQHEILDRLLSEPPRALIVLPIDRVGVRASLQRYRAAGVPVIVLENDPGNPELYRALFIADHQVLGQTMGRFFAEVMGGSGDLVEIAGGSGSSAADGRSAGFRGAIAGTSLRLVETVGGDWLASTALEAFTRVLERRSHIDGVFAQNDEMACGAWDAAVRAGRQDEMLITGIDALRGQRGLQMVMQGRLAATLVNPSPGPAAGEALLAILRDKPSYMSHTVRRTALLQSNERIRTWRAHRSRERRPAPAVK